MISRMSPTPVRRGGVHFHHVDMAAFHDRHAMLALPQGSVVGPPVPSGPMQFMPLAMIRAVVVLPGAADARS
jgi:hypothetical protein